MQARTVAGQPAARSTGVHNVHRSSSIDRPVNRSKESDRPTGMANFLLDSVDQPVDRKEGSVDRPVDRQANLLLLLRFGLRF